MNETEAQRREFREEISKPGTRLRFRGGVAIATGHILVDNRIVLEYYLQDGMNLRKETVATTIEYVTKLNNDEAEAQ